MSEIKQVKETEWELSRNGWRKDVWTLDLGIVKATIFSQHDEGYTIYLHGNKEYVYNRLVADIDEAKIIAARILCKSLNTAMLDASAKTLRKHKETP